MYIYLVYVVSDYTKPKVDMKPVAEKRMKVENNPFFLWRKRAALKIRSQVIDPPQAAALAAALEPSVSGHVAPAALPIRKHVLHQLLVFFWWPKPLPQLRDSAAVILLSWLSHFVTSFKEGWCNFFFFLFINTWFPQLFWCEGGEYIYIERQENMNANTTQSGEMGKEA